MSKLNQAPRGTQDVLPAQSHRWQWLERSLLRTAELYGFRELRLPTFEHTELFCRGVGDATDVVQKEMYTFLDKGNRSITLRPEGTAGTVRALLEHGLLGEALPLRVGYLLSCFRYEKPQAGRLREFHQFGVELFGAKAPSADAEVIALAQHCLTELGLKNLTLAINSIGCPACRPAYHKALAAYFESRREQLCPTCQGRLETNPLRILDCKNPDCGELAAGAPVILDHLCEECADHFAQLQALLNTLDIPYTVDPQIVRGLDYYTRTVFEFTSGEIGAQAAVCGGGRYDGLVETLGGAPTPGLGFAMGLERLLLVLEAQNASTPPAPGCEVYLAPMGEAAEREAARLTGLLRRAGISAQTDLMGRSIKAQMKYADKTGCNYTLVLGESELAAGSAQLKHMATGQTTEITLGEYFANTILEVIQANRRNENV